MARDLRQIFQVLPGALDDLHRGEVLPFPVAVAAPCGLHHAVHSRCQTDRPGKGNIHAGFDHLGGDTDDLPPAGAAQSALQLRQHGPPVGHAHGGGEMKGPVFFRHCAVQPLRLILSVADDQKTVALVQGLPGQGGDALQGKASSVPEAGAPEAGP